jgi:hypothetical protein
VMLIPCLQTTSSCKYCLAAYTTFGVKHTDLIQKVGNHISQIHNLYSFKPQELANAVCGHMPLPE